MSGWRNWPPSSPAPSRAPTHGKRTRILRSTETVRWTFSPSDAVVGDICKTEVETTHEEKHKKISSKGRARAPGGGDRRPGRAGGVESDDGARTAGQMAGHVRRARAERQPGELGAADRLPHPGTGPWRDQARDAAHAGRVGGRGRHGR